MKDANNCTARSMARVKWDNGNVEARPIGHAGQVNIKCTEAGKGQAYYKTHLAFVGK